MGHVRTTTAVGLGIVSLAGAVEAAAVDALGNGKDSRTYADVGGGGTIVHQSIVGGFTQGGPQHPVEPIAVYRHLSTPR